MRNCSECGAVLSDRATTAKTCSAACRSKRSRRIKRQNKEAGKLNALPPHQKALAESVRSERTDVVKEVLKEELRPVVRESITEDVMKAISGLVALTPTVVEKIKEDLESEDAVLRQRAYSLVTKYTVGHTAIVRPPEEEDAKTLIVNFDLPRPGDATPEGEASAIPAEAVEIRQCDSCSEDKPVTDFVANSTRCLTCFQKQQAKAAEMIQSTNAD